jgi:hypothetical protein
MKRVLLSSMALAWIVALGAAPAAAQHASLSIGAGGVKPSGDYATADNMGWQLMGAVEVSVPRMPLAVRVDALYGQTTHQGGLLTGSTKLSGGTVDAVYRIGAPLVPIRAYVLAGLGYYRVDLGAGASESKPAFGGGAGLSLGLGPMKVFGEARYMSIRTSTSPLNFFPVSVGLTFGL